MFCTTVHRGTVQTADHPGSRLGSQTEPTTRENVYKESNSSLHGPTMRHSSLLTLLTSLLLTTAQAAPPATVRLCYDQEDVYPWRVKGGQGLDFTLLKLLDGRVSVHFELQALPWKRCLLELGENRHDGAVAASFRPERMEVGVYPMVGSVPDTNLRMRAESYSLFRLKGSAPSWDGKRFSGIEGNVGAQTGYSIVEQLKTAGLSVDTGTASADDNLRKLMLGRVVAVALLSSEGDASIAANPEFSARIERLYPPLTERAYYLLFSKSFYARDEALAQRIGQALPTVRDSADYKRAEAAMRQP